MSYKGAKKPLPQIGKELDVDAVVEGSVVKIGERVRITVQLVEVATDRHLWAKSYERDLSDVLSLQSEVARAVAAEVRTAITPQEDERLRRVRSVDPEVHELYLQGRYHWNKGTEPEIRRAIELYERVLARDPRSALAYAGIADAWASLTDHFLPPLETMPRARAAAIRALELDETLAESHVALGNVYLVYDWNWSGAEKEYRRAIELNPSYSEAHAGYGHYLAVVGRHAESADEMRKARELDPRSILVGFYSGWNLLLAGRVDESIEVSRKTVELDPSFGWARLNLAIAYVEKGLLADAVSEAEKGIEKFDSPLARATAGTVFAAAGDRKRARQVLDELAAISDQRYVCPYEIALVHLGLGDRDETFRWLEKGFRDRSICMVYTKYDPRLRPLRGDPRYVDLVRRIGFPS
jgi:tetratricopeptide (TPR) repeat protein